MLTRGEPGSSRDWGMLAPAIFPAEAEPALTAEFFKSDPPGFFVDVGAHDAVAYSQTFDLEQRGWTGVLVEPLPDMARQLRTMGVEPLVPPESFFVKAMKKEGPLLAGEVERAASWARMLLNKLEASHPVMR